MSAPPEPRGHGPNAGRPRTLARRLVFAAMLPILLFGAAEALLRLRYDEDELLFQYERPDGLIRKVGEAVHARPDVRNTMHDGPYTWEVAINRDALRSDRVFPRTAPTGTFRVLALGDSWTFGWSVTQGKTWPDVLGASLSEAWGRPVEVLNAGVPGACAFDMAQAWKVHRTRHDFDAVAFGTPHNAQIQRERLAERRAWYEATTDGPRSRLRVYLALRLLLYELSPQAGVTPSWTLPAEHRTPDDEAALNDVLTIVKEAQADGKVVWYLDLPGNASGALRPDSRDQEMNPAWVRVLRAAGVVVAGHALPERACWGFEDQLHPSEAGAEVLGKVLAEAVLHPDPHPSERRVTTPRCADAAGVGPGKDGWEAPPVRFPP